MKIANEVSRKIQEIPQINVNSFSEYRLKKCNKQTLLFLTKISFNQVTNHYLKVDYLVEDIYKCSDYQSEIIKDDVIAKVNESIHRYINSQKRIEYVTFLKSDLAKLYEQQNLKEKSYLLSRIDEDEIECIHLDNYFDMTLSNKFQTDLNLIGDFHLVPYLDGFLLICASSDYYSKGLLNKLDKIKLWTTEKELISLETLNKTVKKKDLNKNYNIVRDEIDSIVRQLVRNFPKNRIIAIAGSTSSGKSTFSKILMEKLIKCDYNGVNFQCISLPTDDYFMNRDERPKDENGNIDFESVRVVHTDQMAERIDKLINGESVPERRYNFVSGIGGDIDSFISLQDVGFLIVEGIHAHNPALLDRIKSSAIVKISIEPLIPIQLDNDHIFDQSDLLLARRFLRDYNERLNLPLKTIEAWPNICTSKEKYIIPYTQQADIFCTCQFIFEINAMSYVAIPLLNYMLEYLFKEDNKEKNEEVVYDIKKLLFLFKLFDVLPQNELPDEFSAKCMYENILKKLNKNKLI